MTQKLNIILSIIILTFIISVSSIGVIQDNSSNQIENQDDDLITEISALKTSGYTVTQKWKWENLFPGDQDAPQVEISYDGNYIVARWDNNPNATLFTKNSNKTVWIFTSPQVLGPRNLLDVAISGDGKYIVVSDDRQVYLLNNSAEDPKTEEWRFPSSPTAANYYVDISLDGNYISVSNGSHIFCLDKTGNLLWTFDSQFSIRDNAVAISGNGRYIITGDTGNNNVYLFNTTDYDQGVPMWKYNAGQDISHVAISDDGNYAVASDIFDDLHFFNTTDYDQLPGSPYGIPMWKYNSPNPIIDLSISSDGKNVAVVSMSHVYYFNNSYSVGWGKMPMWSKSTGSTMTSGDICADGKYVVAGEIPGPSLFLFNNSITNPKEPEWSYTDSIIDVAISGWGNYFIGANDNQEIILFYHARPIPPVLGLILGDDDDDDDETAAIPFGNYYFVFAFGAIVALIIIIKRKTIFTIK